MLRQAVARSEMDCHSSSVESAVSERTVRETGQHLLKKQRHIFTPINIKQLQNARMVSALQWTHLH